jgi:hypothetical protein
MAAAAVSTSHGQALPDLLIWGPASNPSLIVTNIASNDCTVGEGCSGAGMRRLLRFNTQTRNIGAADLVIGSPINNPLFEFDPCHGHYHFAGFAEYRLLNVCGQVAISAKRGFCIADNGRFDPSADLSPVYNCSNQGLQVGWFDLYTTNTPCQWIDITGLAPGTYTLQMEINPERLLTESNYSNNATNITVMIPLLDANANGMGDDWETLYGVSDPNADADGDGMTNLEEFQAGTDPTNSVSALHITSILSEGNDVRITWSTAVCKSYVLQTNSPPVSGQFTTNYFFDLFVVTNAVGTATNHLDLGAATNSPARYYRVRLVP